MGFNTIGMGSDGAFLRLVAAAFGMAVCLCLSSCSRGAREEHELDHSVSARNREEPPADQASPVQEGESEPLFFTASKVRPEPKGSPLREQELRELFFSPDGEEHLSPACAMDERLENAEPDERERLLNYLCDVVERNRGLSRFVALDSLDTYFDAKENWPHMPDRVARTMANYLIDLSPLGELEIVDKTLLQQGHTPKELQTVLKPRCIAYVGTYSVVIWDSLPRGWTMTGKPVVEINGKALPEEGGDLFLQKQVPFAMLFLDRQTDLVNAEVGSWHTITVKVTLRAPNGLEIPKSKTTRLQLVSKELMQVD